MCVCVCVCVYNVCVYNVCVYNVCRCMCMRVMFTVSQWWLSLATTDCAAEVVGDCNFFEPRSHIGEGARIPSLCVVGCGCCVLGGEELPPNTVVFGGAQTRYIQSKQVQVSSTKS